MVGLILAYGNSPSLLPALRRRYGTLAENPPALHPVEQLGPSEGLFVAAVGSSSASTGHEGLHKFHHLNVRTLDDSLCIDHSDHNHATYLFASAYVFPSGPGGY